MKNIITHTISFARSLIVKYREIIVYGIMGVLTTLVNYCVYLPLSRFVFRDVFGDITIFSHSFDGEALNALVCNAIAWCVAVVFAFIVNKYLVFGSLTESRGKWVFQFVIFVSSRALSGIIEVVTPSLIIELFSAKDIIAKIIVSVVCIILNYLFSKFIVFAKRKSRAECKTNTVNIGADGGKAFPIDETRKEK